MDIEALLAKNPTADYLPELNEMVFHPDKAIRVRVAESPDLPSHYLHKLVFDASSDVRIALSENPSTPMLFLRVLAADADPDVRLAMAENSRLPLLLIRLLATDSNPYVAHRARLTIERIKQAAAETSEFVAKVDLPSGPVCA
jgi:hypothetical protein